jgi:hypothetical protein
MHTEFERGTLKNKSNLSKYGRIILKLILKKKNGRLRTEWMDLMRGTSGRLF